MDKKFKKEWQDRLEEIEGEIAAWNDEYETTFDAIAKEDGYLKWWRRMSTTERRAVAEKARRRVGSGPLSKASRFFDELCAYFLVEPLPGERARVRAQIGNHPTAFEYFWSYVVGTPERVQGEAAEAELENGLAAVAIDDLGSRYDDVVQVLGRLWIAGVHAGIDPEPSFKKVAALANPGTSGGGAHMEELMGDFKDSDGFAREVAPMLKVAGRRAS